MKITVHQGEIQKWADESIIVNLFEGMRPGGATGAVDKALDGLISSAIDAGDFTGKKNETLLLYTRDRLPADRVLVVGLGPREKFDLEVARQAAGTAARRLQDLGVASITTILHGTGAGGLDVEEAAQATAEASILACYQFSLYRKPDKVLKELTVLEFDAEKLAAIRRGIRAGRTIAEATSLARDLVHAPSAVATPAYLASTARRIARKSSLKCRIIDEAEMKKLGMNLLLGISRGSAQPARLIVLEYTPKGKKAGSPLVFVGKGVTFDSGGLSLKSGAGMQGMKADMAGGAAVIGAMQAISVLKPPVAVVGLVPATENMPDGKACRPGEVIAAMSGKTVEILNTDAEGRLILADALCYANRFKPAGVVDIATLTGACVTALGHHASGMMSNDDDLADRARAAGENTGERVWPLPLWEEYREQIKSDIADVKNIGGTPAGAITAGAFLSEFTQDYPWVHLDVAGTALPAKTGPYIPKGPGGIGVRLLTQLARNWRKKQ